MPYSPSQIESLLRAQGEHALLPELAGADIAALAARAPGKALLEWARQAPDTWPRTSYTLYRTFKKTGERNPYEDPYFQKRQLLTRAVLAAWLGQDDAAIDCVNDLVWSICEERTWVLPAHERPEPYYIDLFAAETGSELAHVLFVLGKRLPEEIRRQALAEVERRILQPYAEHADDYSWREGRNNWTGVCAGSIGEAFLLLDTDLKRQSEAIARVLEQFQRFLDNAFESDGGCLEGIGYWNYGLLHYVGFAEMLRARTGGAIDLLAQDRVKAIARYPLVAALGKNVFASFADSHEKSAVVPFLAARLAERTGARELMPLVGADPSWRFSSALRNVLWWDGVPAPKLVLNDAYLPASGIAKRVGAVAGKPLVLIAKAGHNAEPHNNNDIGSFILRIGETTYLCDPGAGLYNKDYFGPKRYQNIFANSYGHSVPRIGGQLQKEGLNHKGTMEVTPEKELRITFEEAYDVPALREAVRTLALRPDGAATLTVQFRFEGAGLEVEEAFLTWHDVAIDGATARIKGEDGVLELRTNSGTFAAESLREACEANRKKDILTRITVTFPPQSERTARFEFVLRP